MHQWNANDYAKSSSAQRGWAQELIAGLHLRGNEDILDLGCGDGAISADLADLVPEGSVVGVDKSADMIAFAQKNLGDRAPQLTFQEADASDLPFENAFDLVFSNAALHWVVDHVPVVNGIARALRPGGRAVLSMGGKGNVAETAAAMNETRTDNAWAAYFTDPPTSYGFHGADDYEVWLRDAGLIANRVELVPKDMVHTPEQFAGWIRTTWLPHTQRVPEDQRETFINDFVSRYLLRCPPDADGRVHTAMVRLEVEATKPKQ